MVDRTCLRRLKPQKTLRTRLKVLKELNNYHFRFWLNFCSSIKPVKIEWRLINVSLDLIRVYEFRKHIEQSKFKVEAITQLRSEKTNFELLRHLNIRKTDRLLST